MACDSQMIPSYPGEREKMDRLFTVAGDQVLQLLIS